MVMVCWYVPAVVAGGIPRPKYIELLVTVLLVVGAGIDMPVVAGVPVRRVAALNDVP